LDDDVIVAADNEQGWCIHFWQRFIRQIWTSAARNDRAYIFRNFDRRHQCRSAACARAEIAKPQIARFWLLLCPLCRVNKAFRQQMDIEPKLASLHVDCFLLLREQIKKQRPQSGIVKCPRRKLIPRTVTAAAATVGKKHERTRARRKMQSSRENCSPGLNLHLAHDRRESLVRFGAPGGRALPNLSS